MQWAAHYINRNQTCRFKIDVSFWEYIESITVFEPSIKAAYSTLEEFLPRAGSDYAANRNTDTQPGERKNVSQLSPWVRTRLLPEWKIVQQVLKQHSASAASKFIDEVC
ncbi:MAG: deoxyribodipyrimidine photolyase, partial [Lentimonas sp.]